MDKDIGEGPYGYRSKASKVPIGCAIGTCGSIRFGAIYCCFGHFGGERRGRLGVRSYSPVCSVYFFVCKVVWDS